MTASCPRDLAIALEAAPWLPEGDADGREERFNGYGVVGVRQASGDVLALRRWPASSIGPGYTSVWRRGAGGAWTFYADVPPEAGCQRYVGPVVRDSVITPVRLAWPHPHALAVTIPAVGLEWEVTVVATRCTRAMNALAGALPRAAWTDARALGVLGQAAGAMLGAGPLALEGRMSDAFAYRMRPRSVWLVGESRARLDGCDLGEMTPATRDVGFGDFRLPRRGLFMFGQAFFTARA